MAIDELTDSNNLSLEEAASLLDMVDGPEEAATDTNILDLASADEGTPEEIEEEKPSAPEPTEEAEETEEQTEETPEEQTAEAIETLEELADQLGVPVDDLASNLKHTFTAAGEERTATLSEIIKGHQLRQDYDRGKTELSQHRAALEAAERQRVKEYNSRFENLAATFNVIDQNIVARANTPEMQELRRDDPGEWAAQIQEIERQRMALGAEFDTAVKGHQEFMAGQREQFVKQQGEILQREVPGWGEEKLNSAIEVIRDFGFEQNEIPNVIDHRLVKGALEVAELRQAQSELKAENAKLKEQLTAASHKATQVKTKIPPVTKPKAKPAISVQAKKLEAAKKRFLKTNSLQDAAEYYAQLG